MRHDMTIELRNPEAPATSKQLWLLHILTKSDTRGLNITMSEASKRIEELKNKKPDTDKRPLVNPHASYIQQDKQKLAQIRYDKNNPKPEITFIQGTMPMGESDMVAIQKDFDAKCLDAGHKRAGNDNANVGFYDFDCKDCLFGKSGICEPKWTDAGYMTCAGKVESVSYKCLNHEPMQYSISDYCWRPKGTQCHRKKIDNHCLECAYRKQQFRCDYSNNRNAWARYIPTLENRIKHHSFWLDKYTDNPEALAQVKHMIELITRLIVP